MDDSFTKVAVNVPHLSGFDKSHQNLFSSKCGTITPILIDELIPGSKFSLKLALNAQLPPLAADGYMRCSVKVEAFLVPMRLLAGSFESWFTDQAVSFQSSYGSVSSFTDKKGFLPCIGNLDGTNDSAAITALTSVGSLADFLGFKCAGGSYYSGFIAGASSQLISAMPFLCYHKVYDDWYRNTLVQRPVFVRPSYLTSTGAAPDSRNVVAATAPYHFYTDSIASGTQYIYNSSDSLKLADGTYLYQLRQRNFGLDYFTTATPTKQLGSAQSVTFSTSGATGSFSIEALRVANSIQQFEERNQLAGTRFQDQIRARYGANLSNGVAQRSIFLGAGDFEVYNKGVYQQNALEQQQVAATTNPFDTVGTRYGSAYAQGSDFVVKGSCDEPCYLLVNATLVPRVTYSFGVHRRLTHYIGAGSLTDMANPILQNTGPQPIYQYELTGVAGSNIHGYTDHYAEFKTMEDELHGLLRDGSSLDVFALQRSFAYNSNPQINSSFLEIPTTYLDQVAAASSSISQYGYWCDTYFDYKVSQPLAKYSLPSLQDPAYEHGKSVVMAKGGSRL